MSGILFFIFASCEPLSDKQWYSFCDEVYFGEDFFCKDKKRYFTKGSFEYKIQFFYENHKMCQKLHQPTPNQQYR